MIVTRRRFSGRMNPSVRTADSYRVSLWDVTDSDTVVDGYCWYMPKAFATMSGVVQWRAFLEELDFRCWDAATVWAEWRGLKPGGVFIVEDFRRAWVGRWRDWEEYVYFYPGARREDYKILRSCVSLYSMHFFKVNE